MTQKKYYYLTIGLLTALILGGTLFLMIGPSGFSPTIAEAILPYRFCRLLLAIIAGSSLAASGASLQALFRNPLADPHLFGISGGAALGASIVIAFFSNQGMVLPSLGAIVGGLCSFLIIFYYVESANDGPLSNCLLVGVIINSLAASIITLLKTMLPAHKSQSLLFWLVGHITMVNPSDFLFIIPLWLFGMLSLWSIKGKLEILSFGIEESQTLGIDTHQVIRKAIVANCILIGMVVAFAGMIGFLGLVIPHLTRLTINANLRFMLPLSALAGALFMVFFDALSRMSFMILQSEIPTGALSALFLSPVFFILLVMGNHDEVSH